MSDSLRISRERITAAYDPELLKNVGGAIVSLLAEHFQKVQSAEGSVLNWVPPEELILATSKQLRRSGTNSAPATRMEELAATALAKVNNLHHPRYVGHQVPASLPLAAMFELVGTATNQVMAIYEMGPMATAVEQSVINGVGEQLGFIRGKFAGLVTSGGSLANLTGLLTARNVSLPGVWSDGILRGKTAPVLVTHAEAHYCVTRAAGVLGLGTEQIIHVGLDSQRRMDPHQLEDTLRRLRSENVPIVAVSAAACATPIGAFDPLADIAAICRRYEVWLHVDAAHGGAACFSDKHKHLVYGIEEAASVVCDAHKMMFMPALCAMLFYRDKEHRFAAFHQDAPYLFDPSAPELSDYDSGLVNLECTKRAAALGLWATWATFGKQLFADLVDVTFELASQFHEMLVEADGFEAPYRPQCNIVVFRYLPNHIHQASTEAQDVFQHRLRRSVIESGEAYLVSNRIDGRTYLRTTIINPLTTASDLEELLSILRRHAKKLSA